MKKRINLATMAVLLVLMSVSIYIITYTFVYNDLSYQLDGYKQREKRLEKIVDAYENIDRGFVGDWTEEQILDGAVRGMIESLNDRWSHYLTADEYLAYTESRDNKYVGIGISAAQDSDSGGIIITEVYSGSPAQEAGLAVRDVIVGVGGEDVEQLGYYQAIELIRGEEGTSVELTVRTPSGEEKTVSVMRSSIMREVVTRKIFGSAGYIKVLNFDSRVDKDFIAAVDGLLETGVESLVIDMRGNPGGSLGVLVPMLDYLLPEGVLITMKSKDGAETPYMSGESCVGIPMVVLVNADSYSAAEFFAACLQEYGWAEIVGEKTVGKGYAQTQHRLSDGSALLLSTSEYFMPSGESLAGVGLTPNYEIVLTDEEQRNFALMSPEEDRQLQKALEILGVVG